MKKFSFLKIARTLLLALTICVTAFVLFFAVRVFSLDAWHDFDPEKILGADQTLIIYSADGAEHTRLHATEDRIGISIDKVPDIVQKAFVSAEDARYYEHKGIDVIRIFGAAWEDIKAGGFVQGASTITQQLIKLSHLTSEKTISRKLEEAVLAYQMEKQFDKNEILEMYLNYVYFGRGYYGIEAAALGYFGVHAEELSLAEGAALAGILNSPSRYAPHIAPEACLGRRNRILALMSEYGYISEAEEEASRAEPIEIIPEYVEKRNYYVDAALGEAAAILDTDGGGLLRGGYRIYTNMDAELQDECEEIFAEASLFPAEDCEGALSIIRPSNGSVAALVGGRGEYVALAFNRATDIRRQPGSVIKPILVYAPALESAGYTAATMILDEKTDFAGYSPSNFNDKYFGWVTLREAVKRSLNVPAVKVFESIGTGAGMAFARRLGISFEDNDESLALALGGFTYGVSPLEISSAYAAFAAGGIYRVPSLVSRIEDAEGNIVYEAETEENRVMSEENAFILTSMLESAISEGTGRRLGELNIPLAGKTGTVDGSEGNRDAWMAAYNSEYSACVWMGYDSASVGELPSGSTGGNAPALVLRRLFSYLYPDSEAPAFAAPEGVIEVALDAHTLSASHEAVLANAFTPEESTLREVFRAGTEPLAVTTYWAVPSGVRGFSVSLSGSGKPVVSFDAGDKRAVYRLYRSANGGTYEEVYQVNGGLVRARFEDAFAPAGSVSYYAVAEHEKLRVNGKAVCGPESAKMSIFVPPFAGGGPMDITDLELPDGEEGWE